MVLGFISLLLTFGQNYIASICIPSKYGHAMSFCGPYDAKKYKKANRQMINFSPHRRSLADAAPVKCKTVIFGKIIFRAGPGFLYQLVAWIFYVVYIDKIVFHFFFFQGYVPLISLNALHQVHIFIFFLAVFHVIYSAITMMLGRAKVYA